MNSILLQGCTPEPLMSYLKALGVFRLVAEQADPSARLSWHGGMAILHTQLDREGLIGFFLENYCPTPVVTPWNGGGGFQGSATDPVVAIEKSQSKRVALYQETIGRIKPLPLTKMEKEDILSLCRNELSDKVLDWLDTCFVLSDDRVSYFPLLGTGGNDGRLEFANNFMQRLLDVLPIVEEEIPKASFEFLSQSLFADTVVSLKNDAIGQFSPGSIGGANGAQGRFEASSRVNPWDYVLMIEGSLLFAGSISRRMNSSGGSKGVFPFSVESVAVGYGSANANEETMDGSRAELWLPLWESPISYAELRQLFAEGRAQVGRRQARNTVEFALAVNLLGICRGVTSFSRYGFLKRNGLAFLATPLGRLDATPRPQASLLDDSSLREWTDKLRRACNDKDKTPSRYQSAIRDINQSIFDFSNCCDFSNEKQCFIEVLRAIGRAERIIATEGLSWLKDKQYGWKVRPLANLDCQWLEQANDNSPEFRLAASLAGSVLNDENGNPIKAIRAFIEPVEGVRYLNWNPSSVSAVWSKQSLERNLAAVFRRCQVEATQHGTLGVPITSRVYARVDDVVAFLNGDTDDDKFCELLWGLLGVVPDFIQNGVSHLGIPFEYGVPRLLVQQANYTVEEGQWKLGDGDSSAKPDPDVFHLLATGKHSAINDSITRAAQRLKSGGLLINGYRNRYQAGKPVKVSSAIRPERLLAAMLFPLSNDDLARIANSVLYLPEREA